MYQISNFSSKNSTKFYHKENYLEIQSKVTKLQTMRSPKAEWQNPQNNKNKVEHYFNKK